MRLEEYEQLKGTANELYALLRKMTPRLPKQKIVGVTPDVAVTHERIANVMTSRVKVTLIIEDELIE